MPAVAMGLEDHFPVFTLQLVRIFVPMILKIGFNHGAVGRIVRTMGKKL